MTGTNTYGELGDGKNATVKSFTRIGETKIVTDEEVVYLDFGESREVKSKLINTFNLKVDTVDSSKENFTYSIEDTSKVTLSNYNVFTAVNYGVVKVTITHDNTGISKEIVVKVVKKMDDIIKGIRDCDLTDGIYEIMVQGEIYTIELYNYYNDMVYSLDSLPAEGEQLTPKTYTLGNDTADETMLVVKYHKNLKVEEGVTLTSSVRKKGMYVCVIRRYRKLW